METFKEGGAISRPPLLDGSNYAYWKARMKAFLNAIDAQAWKAILTGWTHPTTTDEKGEKVHKPEVEWTTTEDHLATSNSKALNAIFNAVDLNQFKLISTCETAKEAWDILKIAHEGTNAVKLSKLQILTTRFENLKMKEEETITEFNARLCDIANEAFALGEKISEEKLVRKALRSLPKRFAYKVTAIEEAKDVQKMKLEELIGSLRTFEMNLQEGKKEKKNIGIAFQADTVEATDFEESMVLLSKNLNEAVKRFRKKNRNNIGGSEASAQNKGIQCRECEGFGHIQSECANTAKKKGKSFNAMWSDEDSDGSREEDGGTGNHLAFTTKFSTGIGTVVDTESSDDENMSEEAMVETYRLALEKCEEVAQVNQSLKHQVEFLQNKNFELESTVFFLQEEIVNCKGREVSVKTELECMKKSMKMLNSGATQLNQILRTGRP